MQLTLFDSDIEDKDEEIIQKYHIDQYHKRGSKVFNDALEHYKYVEEHNKRVAEKRGCSFPCPEVCKLPIDERPKHIKNCDACKKLERELDEKVGIKKHIYS